MTDAATTDAVETIKAGYTFSEPAVELGVLVENGEPVPDCGIRIPLGMMNRHGLVAGATGTGKTKTLQLMAEQLSAAGVPVFAADIKGDLTGLATPGQSSDKLLARTQKIGQQWEAKGFPVEFYALGGIGTGVPLRATVSSFGPILLSKVLGLNQTQESSLGLVFHYADSQGLALLDLADLRAVLTYLTSDEGKPELKGIGGLSATTVGVILRSLVTLESQGGDQFFGEPEFDSNDLLRVFNGMGLISLVELPNLNDRPALFSTFLMWLMADLFHDLPEVGDPDKPKLVFFFDEAHLLFDGASKAFLDSIAQTVRLIRSKGVGVFFVTQTPKDVPDDVLAQLGSRVQHQLRAHTPNDAKALKATVSTFPTSHYDDLGQTLQELGIGEAIVTVMDPDGSPTPVAWTRMRAPQSLMAPSDPGQVQAWVAGSPIMGKYGTALNRESAQEILAKRLEEGAKQAEAEAEAEQQAKEADRQEREDARTVAPRRTTRRREKSVVEEVASSGAFKQVMRTATTEIVRSIFGTARRRR